jgi:hypothetical protein
MPSAKPLSGTVVFEVLDWKSAERLCEHLRHRGQIRLSEFEGAALVSVEPRPEEGDLATLLRAVKECVDASALGKVRFQLDGRAYVIAPGTAIAVVT